MLRRVKLFLNNACEKCPCHDTTIASIYNSLHKKEVYKKYTFLSLLFKNIFNPLIGLRKASLVRRLRMCVVLIVTITKRQLTPYLIT